MRKNNQSNVRERERGGTEPGRREQERKGGVKIHARNAAGVVGVQMLFGSDDDANTGEFESEADGL